MKGEWFDPPEFHSVGIDIVRSDRAAVTRDVAESVLKYILKIEDTAEAREKVYAEIQGVVEDIRNGNVEKSYMARPKGMGQAPAEYGSVERRPQPTYRGAKYANDNFEWEQMGEGSKPQLLYIEKVRGNWPRTYDTQTAEDGDEVDAIAVEHPNQIPDEFVIDVDKQVEKVLEDPLTPILSPMNWSFDEALSDTEQTTLAEMM